MSLFSFCIKRKMEKMTTSIEEVCDEASVSKSSRLSIDLHIPFPVIVNGGDCQHFSIRQYVAEMRKKDMKICSPFELSSHPSKKLPSPSIPKQNNWWCANCIHKIGVDESITDKIGVRVEETGNPATKVILSKKYSTRELETDCLVVNCLNNNTNTESIPSNDGNDKVTPHGRRCVDGRDSEIDLEKEKSSINRQRIASNTSDQIKISGGKEIFFKMSTVKLHELSSLESRKDTDQTSKGTDANLTKNSLCDFLEDIENDLENHKTKKLQLMTGLLSEKVNLEMNSVYAKLFSANTMPMEPDTVIAPKNNSVNVSQKKRNVFQEDECWPGNNKLDCKMDKRVKALNQKKKAMRSSIGMVTSLSENELSYKEKLNLTLSSFRDAQKHIENDTIQSKSTINWPLTPQKGNKYSDPLRSNMVVSDQSSRQAEIDLNKKIDLNQRQISPNLLQWENLQIHLMETPHPSNNINLNEVQGHSYITVPQRKQRLIKIMERGSSAYVPPMGIMEMSKNQHERTYPQTQNRVLPWSNPISTNFHPFDANFGFLRSSTATAQQQLNLSNVVQVSTPVPTRLGLQHGIWLPVAQNIEFRPNNLQNYPNQENYMCGQAAPVSLQKGRTISDIKTMDLKRVENITTKGIGSLNHILSEGTLATQLLKHQEKHFAPCIIHPPLNMDGKPGMLNGPILSYHQLKECSSVYMADFTVGQNFQKHIYYFNAKFEFPLIHMIRAFIIVSHNYKVVNFTDQVVSLRSKEKKRKAHTPAQLGGRKLQQSTFSRGILCTTRDPGPKVDLMQDDNVSKLLDVRRCSVPAVVSPISSTTRMDPPCLFNQNPIEIANTNDERYFRTANDQIVRDESSS